MCVVSVATQEGYLFTKFENLKKMLRNLVYFIGIQQLRFSAEKSTYVTFVSKCRWWPVHH